MPGMADGPPDARPVGGAVAFVYFRSAPEQRDAVRVAFDRLSLALRQAGWPRPESIALRHEPARDYFTWLETYRGPNLERLREQLAAVERLAAVCGLSGLALNGRHVEIFEACA